ncbi:hypothetical protein CSW29_11875 [Thermus scotoductus]|uniref:PLD phosphodiesterase domain-containing protein n=1 Tax=Thermus scotoductus TaxID=37636 RepID=A0A430UEC2_THESC|nr:phospholipase D family protein [Thermus scotoductus]RTH97203.1 hypothetical protein CSW29_11875 [Thermus scotoductus]
MMELFSKPPKAIRVRFEGEVPFSLSDLEGADRLRVLTFSASEDLVRKMALSVGELEMILGHPIPAAGVDGLLALQSVALEDLRGQVQRDGELLERIRQGRLRFYLSKRSSHSKLFLVEKGEERFAIVGSANFSNPALRGSQVEILLWVEDPEGFRYFEELYEEIRRESDLVKYELTVREARPEELPILEKASKAPVVLTVAEVKEVPVVHRVDLISRRSEAFAALAKAVRVKEGRAVLEPKALKALQLAPPPKREEETSTLLLRVRDGEGLEVLETLQPFLEVDDPGVREDAEGMVAFMEGYLQGDFLYAEEAQEQVAGYWRLWAWFWTAPLMHRLVRRAHLEGYSPHAYPLYALVYGKANTGKTTFLRLLLRSVAGVEVGVYSSADLSKNNLRGVHASGSELPVVFDDIDPKDVGEKVEPVLKSLYEVPQGTLTPVALSLNASQNYAAPDQVRKRALLVWTGAVLDTTRPQVAHRVHGVAQKILLATGNRLYRAFLPRLLSALEEEKDWLAAATGTLSRLLTEVLGQAPDWARSISLEEVSEERLSEVKAKLLFLLKTHRLEWRGGHPALRIGSVDAKRYAKEFPGWLVEGAQGELLVLKEKGLKRLGVLPRWRWPWG